MNMIQTNIRNLTNLWRTAAECVDALSEEVGYQYIDVPYSEWPNRLWFQEKPTEKIIREAVERIESTDTKLIVPIWHFDGELDLASLGFEELFSQSGMGLELKHRYPVHHSLNIARVQSIEDAKLWESLFQRCFNYNINQKLIHRCSNRIEFFLISSGHDMVGTAVMHYTDGVVAGIHSVGILPQFRRKGLADQLMKLLLNMALNEGAQWTVLQASEMGKSLYEKLGFEQHFIIRNYQFIR